MRQNQFKAYVRKNIQCIINVLCYQSHYMTYTGVKQNKYVGRRLFMFFNNRQNKDLSEKLVKLVVPIAIQQFMLALVSATDAMMLGFVDQASLSAVSLAGQI